MSDIQILGVTRWGSRLSGRESWSGLLLAAWDRDLHRQCLAFGAGAEEELSSTSDQ